jgi:hypothetical protein
MLALIEKCEKVAHDEVSLDLGLRTLDRNGVSELHEADPDLVPLTVELALEVSRAYDHRSEKSSSTRFERTASRIALSRRRLSAASTTSLTTSAAQSSPNHREPPRRGLAATMPSGMLPSTSDTGSSAVCSPTAEKLRRISSMTAVTGGTQKSRLWASNRIGSDATNAPKGDPGLRCRHMADAHARDRRAPKSADRYLSGLLQSAM